MTSVRMARFIKSDPFRDLARFEMAVVVPLLDFVANLRECKFLMSSVA